MKHYFTKLDFMRTAMMLLVIVFASQTVWADNIEITSANFTDYFDYNDSYELKVGSGETIYSDVGGYFLKGTVAAESTLDFKGEFTPPTDGKNPRIFINKRVNITSSDKSAVFKSGDTGKYWCFGMVEGADYAEVKNLQFDNCWLFVHGASHVTFDGIDLKVHDANIGATNGTFSIATLKDGGALSEYVTIKNSHFNLSNSYAACIVVGKGGSHATIDNNIVEATENVNNLLFSTVFVGSGNQPEFVTYSNNDVTREGASAATSWSIIVCGQGNLVENNKVNYAGVAITTTMGGSPSDEGAQNIYRNNTITGGGSMSVYPYSLVENNHVSGTLTLDKEVTAICNTALQLNVNYGGDIIQDNTIYGSVKFNNNANQSTFTGNAVMGALTHNAKQGANTITGNAIVSSEEYAVQSTKASTNNRIEYNMLVGAAKQGDEAVAAAIGTENTIQYNNGGTVITNETSTMTATDNGACYYVPENTTVTIPGNVTVTGSADQRVNIILMKGAKLTINGQLTASGKTIGIYAMTNDETTGSISMNGVTYKKLIISSGKVTVDNGSYDAGLYKAKYDMDLTSEYNTVPTIYAGCQNYFKLDIENTSETDGSNVSVNVYADDVMVNTIEVGDLPAGESKTLEDVVDPTIRPVDENTVIGNDNKNVVYKIEVTEDGVVTGQAEFSFVILYNGNLGKDYAYPYTEPFLRSESFTGDVLALKGDGYSTNNDTSREDVIAVDLGGGSVHKAFLYVSYNWDKVAEGDFKSWTTTFNDKPITPEASYRDQSNLGKYGEYGYGLVVYDVTEAVVDGDNTFALQKTAGNVAVYPSSLIVMVENSSSDPKVVYIAEEADLLSYQYNQHMDPIYNSSFKDVAEGDATLYVFAANAQAGEGDIIINDETKENVWSGTSQTVEIYETPVDAGDVAVQFRGTGSTILALQQMLVVETTKDIPGDINGDGVVNVIDLVKAIAAGKPQAEIDAIVNTIMGK